MQYHNDGCSQVQQAILIAITTSWPVLFKLMAFIIFFLVADIVSQSVWWHFLVINIPDKIEFSDSAFIYITGGDNRPYVCRP